MIFLPPSPSPCVALGCPKMAVFLDKALLRCGILALKPPRGSRKPTTFTLKHIAAKLAEKHDMPKKQAETLLNDLVETIVGHLKKGERIRMVGLGILQVRKRAARMGRNPATGEPIQIKASKKVAFRASKELKEAV